MYNVLGGGEPLLNGSVDSDRRVSPRHQSLYLRIKVAKKTVDIEVAVPGVSRLVKAFYLVGRREICQARAGKMLEGVWAWYDTMKVSAKARTKPESSPMSSV